MSTPAWTPGASESGGHATTTLVTTRRRRLHDLPGQSVHGTHQPEMRASAGALVPTCDTPALRGAWRMPHNTERDPASQRVLGPPRRPHAMAGPSWVSLAIIEVPRCTTPRKLKRSVGAQFHAPPRQVVTPCWHVPPERVGMADDQNTGHAYGAYTVAQRTTGPAEALLRQRKARVTYVFRGSPRCGVDAERRRGVPARRNTEPGGTQLAQVIPCGQSRAKHRDAAGPLPASSARKLASRAA